MGLSEDEAMDILAQAIDDKLTEGAALVASGEEDVNGEHCWLFSFGKSTPEKFTAEEHYAVGDTGVIYIMDIAAGGEYVPLEK